MLAVLDGGVIVEPWNEPVVPWDATRAAIVKKMGCGCGGERARADRLRAMVRMASSQELDWLKGQ